MFLLKYLFIIQINCVLIRIIIEINEWLNKLTLLKTLNRAVTVELSDTFMSLVDLVAFNKLSIIPMTDYTVGQQFREVEAPVFDKGTLLWGQQHTRGHY